MFFRFLYQLILFHIFNLMLFIDYQCSSCGNVRQNKEIEKFKLKSEELFESAENYKSWNGNIFF